MTELEVAVDHPEGDWVGQAGESPGSYRDALFLNWRYDTDGAEIADFVLNQPKYRSATILVAGPNFGSGSSRETAVWALHDFGIRAIIAPSFASIFETNCVRNGLLPLSLPADVHQRFVHETFSDETPAAPTVDIDLQRCKVRALNHHSHPFTIDERARRQLLNGLDAISETLLLTDDITRFRQRDRQRRPWLYPSVP